MKCTFFGHSDTPWEIQQNLEEILSKLIETRNVNTFYLGNQGNFDRIALKALKNLKNTYTDINFMIVLAYIPHKKSSDSNDIHSDTIYPECLENTPPKYAIIKRNLWMIDKCDYVVTYVKYHFGGAAKFKLISERKSKTVINLADNN